jgi:hypothetical protein
MSFDANAKSLCHLGNPPEVLYKYRPLGEFTEILLRGELWFAKPEDLNDPSEFRILTRGPLDRRDAIEVALEYQSAAAPHLVRDTQDWEDWVKNVSESLLRAQLRGSRVEQSYFGESPVGVFCLCEKPNDVRMWSHYANSHSGVCIGLSSQRIQTESRIAKVEYCDSMPTVPLKNVLQGGPAAFLTFLCKSRVWVHEDEWRCFNVSGAKIFPADIVKTVIFGSRMPDAERVKLMSIIRGYKHEVTVLQARLKPSDYGLELEPVQI